MAAASEQLAAAKEQLREGQKIAYGDFLLRLDEAFQRHQVVHTKLHPGNEWSLIDPDDHEREKVDGPEFPKDGPAVVGYMGLFERVQILLEKGLIDDISTIDRLYGYRLFNIVNNPIIYKERLVKHGYEWIDFIKLWQALCKLDSNKGMTEPSKEILDHLPK